ncbi:MAG: LCP family protein [Coriobacteriia bacterium]|nr:LCP family protein [Coriobacteriia bacterium]
MAPRPSALTRMGPIAPRRPRLLLAIVAAAVVVAAIAVGLGYAAYLNAAISFPDSWGASQLANQLAGSSMQSNNVLIASVEATSGNSATGTGSLVLVHLDPAHGRVWELWIPPDVQSLVAGYGYVPMSDAHLYGGSAGTVKAVKRLTGLSINEYVEVNPQAIRTLTEYYGGAWVNVPTAIQSVQSGSAPSYPITSVLAGWQRVDAEQALTLMRVTPAFADPDYALIQDQQLVVTALATEVGASPSEIPGAVRVVAPYLKTTMSLNELLSLGSALRSGGPSIDSAVVIGTRTGKVVVPDTKILKRLIAAMQAGQPFGIPGATLAGAAAQSAAVVSSKPASQVRVTVKNGSGLSGAAKQAAGVLQTHGFAILSTGNANINVYNQTYVVYHADKSLAELVAQYLQPGVKIVPAAGLYSFPGDVLVMVGKDWDLSKAPVAPIQTK